MSTSSPKPVKHLPTVVKDSRRGPRRRVLPSPGAGEADRQRDHLRLQMEAELDARYEAGVRDGKAEAESALRGSVDAAVRDLEHQASAVREAGRRQVLALEQTVVDIVLQIASKVLTREVQARPDVALNILRSALIAVADQDVVGIRVSPESIAHFRETVSSLGDVLADPDDVTWIPDRRVAPGGVVIETLAGKVDATIAAQLDEVSRVLRDVLDGQHA